MARAAERGMAAADAAARRARRRAATRRSRSSPSSRSRLHNAQTGCRRSNAETERIARTSVPRAEAARVRRGGGPAGRAHRRGACECRSRPGGFAAPRGRCRTRGAGCAPQRARAAREHAAAVAARWRSRAGWSRRRLSASSAVASAHRDELAAERRRADRGAGAVRQERRADRQDRRADRRAAPRRGRESPSGPAHRAARAAHALEQFGMAACRPDRRVRARRPIAADRARDWPSTSRPGSAASRSSRLRRCRTTGRPRSDGQEGRARARTSSAGSIRWRSRSSRRWRSATTSCPRSSRTSRRPARTCSTSIADVDDRILQVFAEAYDDVRTRVHARCSPTLFPGGEGRLLLTNPDDMLTTGIEVEARPPGKKIKRLSLLSGGEKSLTAVAMLVAIFRARPSPFYVMDEVEAALDDANLRRLISLFEQLRETVAADRHHPPEADDGGRRRAVRRHHARRRHHDGDLAADARPGWSAPGNGGATGKRSCQRRALRNAR